MLNHFTVPESVARIFGRSVQETAERIVPACGCVMLILWMQTFEDLAVLGNVDLFNTFLVAIGLHALALIGISIASRATAWLPGRLTASFAGVVAGLAILVYWLFPNITTALLVSVVFGIVSALLTTFWLARLAMLTPRQISILVLSFLTVALLICLGLSKLDAEWATLLLVAILPILSGLLALFALDSPDGSTSADVQTAVRGRRQRVPYAFLTILGACCVVSAFFAGSALNPYIFQSARIYDFWLLFSAGILCVLLIIIALTRRANIQAFFIVALVALILGLYLLSSGSLGSIIIPLSLISATETCCAAFCIIVVTILAKRLSHPGLVIACGMLIGDGLFFRGFGMFANAQLGFGFSGLATGGAIAIVILTIMYAVIALRSPDTARLLLDDADATATTANPARSAEAAAQRRQEVAESDETRLFFEQIKLTKTETNVATAILEGGTYKEVAERLDITERTVKFHSSNIYKKAGVKTRGEFEMTLSALGEENS